MRRIPTSPCFKITTGLGFVPEAHAKRTFELVVEEFFEISNAIYEEVCEKADELCTYFKTTYIENCNFPART